MLSLLRRRRTPLLVVALAATPLLAPTGANAALAGGATLNSSVTADLISATVTNVTPSGTTINFCFNKTLGSTPVFNRFGVLTYRNQGVVANSAVANGQCVAAVFNGVLDPQAFTVAAVGPGAVVNGAVGAPTGDNNADATALIQASGAPASQNGTRGRTVAPDLLGVTVSGSNVTYSFDEALGADDGSNTINPVNFTMQDNTGADVAFGGGTPTISADRKSVTVAMTGGVPVVTSAVRATYSPNASPSIVSLATAGGPVAQLDATWWTAVGTPGNGVGNTNISDPIAANLVDAGNTATIDLIFDQPTLAADAAGAAPFIVGSDGVLQPLALVAAPQTNANTVRFEAPAFNLQGEYIVGVTVPGNAGVISTGFVPAGGNAGALALGFTTAADARRATIDTSTGSATVVLDQRYSSAVPGFLRVDNTGTVNANPPSSLSFGDTTVPKETTITANYGSVGGVAGTRGIQIVQGALSTALTPILGDTIPRNANVTQIVGVA